MSHWSDFRFACSSTVNIAEPAFYFTVMLRSTASEVKLPRFSIPIVMLDSKSLNTMLGEVMISYQYECVIICDLNDLTLQIILDAWWASMNVRSMSPIASNDSRHATVS
jgi:hypothetical protein